MSKKNSVDALKTETSVMSPRRSSRIIERRLSASSVASEESAPTRPTRRLSTSDDVHEKSPTRTTRATRSVTPSKQTQEVAKTPLRRSRRIASCGKYQLQYLISIWGTCLKRSLHPLMVLQKIFTICSCVLSPVYCSIIIKYQP